MKLWLIRHAKSDWKSPSGSDFERPLSARGERDGPRMAAWLAAQREPAAWIWSSDALRASSTAHFIAEAFGAGPERVVGDHRLYDASPEALMEVIRETPPDIASAAVVAHNPGISVLVNLLADSTVTEGLPTFGVARLELPAPWIELRFGQGRLELLTSPKRLAASEP
jgi:phosphohistidine phosphatase